MSTNSHKFDIEYVQKLKDEGNEFFKQQKYDKAIESYTKALNAPKWPMKEAQLHAVLLTNRAACYVQTHTDLDKCIEDCTLAISEHPTYGKAFYRRSQAFELQGKIKEAFQDMRELAKLEPHNKVAAAATAKLLKTYEEQQDQTNRKHSVPGIISMVREKNIIDDETMSTLYSLLREDPPSINLFLRVGGVPTLQKYVFSNIKVLRIFAFVSTVKDGALQIFEKIGVDPFLENVKQIFQDEEQSSSTVKTVNTEVLNKTRYLLGVVSGIVIALDVERIKGIRKNVVETYVLVLTRSKTEELQITALNEIIKLPWGTSFDANEFVEIHFGDLLFMTDENTLKQLVSLAISKLFAAYHNHKDEDEFHQIKTQGQLFFKKFMMSTSYKDNVKALSALSSLLLANVEIGVMVLFKEIQSIVDAIEVMDPRLPEFVQIQILVAEILAIAAGNQNFQKTCDPNTLEDLLSLLKSDNHQVQIRVATVTSKLASANEKIKNEFFKDKGAGELAKIQQILHSKEKESFPWAIEALSFISFNADVKEKIINDKNTLDSIFQVARSGDKTLWYGAASTFLNLCRYIRLDEVTELQKQLQQVASGEQATKKIELDLYEREEYVNKRCIKLVENGIVPILITMTKDEEEKIGGLHEVLAEIFCHLATVPANRGKIMQAGALKSLVMLTSINSDRGKNWAAHAIAKIAISVDPHLAFHDQYATRVITPLMGLLKSEDGLQNFEALMALTNLTVLGEDTVSLILRNHGYSTIEMCQISDHELIRRAASELLCNLTQFSDVSDQYKDDQNTERRLKMWNALTRSEDLPTAIAASGALAILSQDPEVCEKMVEHIGVDNLLELIADQEHPELQHRAGEALKNMVQALDRAAVFVAEKKGIIPLLQCMAHSKSREAKDCCSVVVEKMSELQLINLDE